MAAVLEPVPPPRRDLSVDDVADMFASMTKVSAEFHHQLDLIAGAPQPLSQITVDALTRLLAIVAPAVRTRQQMALLEPTLLMAGIKEWLCRAGLGADASARARADRVWALGGMR